MLTGTIWLYYLGVAFFVVGIFLSITFAGKCWYMPLIGIDLIVITASVASSQIDPNIMEQRCSVIKTCNQNQLRSYYQVDIEVQIIMDLKAKADVGTIVRSNATKEGTEEILSDYIRSQMGKGVDGRKPNNELVYRVTIGVDLSDDSFSVQSNTGNASLTTGIACEVFKRLRDNKLAVSTLE